MKDTFNNVVIYNGYPLSVVVAITFHSVILALLLYLQSGKSPEALELVQPTVVKALLIQENPQVANERKRLERQQQQQRTREREVAQQAAEAERQRQEQADSRAEEQRKARELASLRQRQEQERLDADQLVREREEQNELEQEQRRQLELAEAQRQQESRDRERQRQEEAANAAAELASSEFEMVQSGMAIIQQAVQSVWSRPPSARNGMRAILQIRMLPTGELIDAVITESSGDPAFDRSAENAVYSAAPFRELQALPFNVFNENFRSLSLIFQPEDLLN
jgi:colicin import membrane protein